MKIIFRMVFLLAFCGLVVSQGGMGIRAQAASMPDPTEGLRPFINQVVAILTDKELAAESKRQLRRDKVMALVREKFDFFEMSKRVLGKEWQSLSKDEQQRFVDMFIKLLEHAYIGKIEGYSKQKVEFGRQRIRGNRAQVETTLVDGDVSLPVSYIMILEDNKWYVYDVVVDGVSLVRNYMTQFQQILREEHFSGLMKRLEEKIRQLEATKDVS